MGKRKIDITNENSTPSVRATMPVAATSHVDVEGRLPEATTTALSVVPAIPQADRDELMRRHARETALRLMDAWFYRKHRADGYDFDLKSLSRFIRWNSPTREEYDEELALRNLWAVRIKVQNLREDPDFVMAHPIMAFGELGKVARALTMIDALVDPLERELGIDDVEPRQLDGARVCVTSTDVDACHVFDVMRTKRLVDFTDVGLYNSIVWAGARKNVAGVRSSITKARARTKLDDDSPILGVLNEFAPLLSDKQLAAFNAAAKRRR